MDFLKIRSKAKERAAADRAAGESAGPPAAPGEAAAAPPAQAPQATPVLTEADVVAGKLAARLQGLPEPEAGADPRFTTWRPGSGERPSVALPELPEPRPAPSDFTVYDPSRSLPLLAPAAPPAPEPAVQPLRPPAAVPDPARRDPGAAALEPLDDFFFREDETVSALEALPLEAGPAEAGDGAGAAVEEYLTFRLGEEEYALAIEHVREVLRSPPITEVPRAPAGFVGVVTVRGEVVAVFDPRRRLGLPGRPPPEGEGRIVIVHDGGGACGLLVDSVASVVRLAGGSIEPCPQGIGGASADCLAGIGRERSRLFMVLDLGALLRRAPAAPPGARGSDAGR